MRDLIRILVDALLDRPRPLVLDRSEGRHVSVYEIGMAKARYRSAQRPARPQRQRLAPPAGRFDLLEPPAHGVPDPVESQP
jgi:hypothetical protein